jgi:hypothetical protein
MNRSYSRCGESEGLLESFITSFCGFEEVHSAGKPLERPVTPPMRMSNVSIYL